MQIFTSYKVKIIRSEKEFSKTAKVYQSALHYLLDVVAHEWPMLKNIRGDSKKNIPSSQARQMALEHLVHRTAKTPSPKYHFDEKFYKLPSYLRRAAIMEALGMYSSFQSNLANWEQKSPKNRGRKPHFPTVGRSFPALYKGNMFIPSDGYTAKIKVFIRNTWDWMTVRLRKSDVDYITRHCQNRKMSSPTLRQRGNNWYLDFSFEERAELKKTKLNNTIVLGVDLGLNSACVCSAMTIDGTVIGRRFLDLPVGKDRLSHILGQIRKSQRLGGQKNTARWARANGINKHMAQQTAKFITGAAEKFGADVIVFEHLNFRGEKRLGKYAQKMALWKANEIQRITADKAHRLGMHISHICARNTSKLAFDGSGEVKRNPKNYSICTFKTGKQYNCDLSASYNIGARYFIRALLKSLSKKARLDMEAKVPSCSKRITCTLSTLISLRAAMAPSGAVC